MDENPYQSPQEDSPGEHFVADDWGYRLNAFVLILVWMLWALVGIFVFASLVAWLF